MRVGVLELLTDSRNRGHLARLYAHYFRRPFMSLMPQAVSVWCRQLGHQAFYATYCGNGDPRSLLPSDLDIVFIATYTQASALAYALAKIYHRAGVRTVIGGPHAKAFPVDCQRFFDLAVLDCDRTLIDDILSGRVDPPAIVSSNRSLTALPLVEERMPGIIASAFTDGRPALTSLVPMLASIGCPYSAFAANQSPSPARSYGIHTSSPVITRASPSAPLLLQPPARVSVRLEGGGSGWGWPWCLRREARAKFARLAQA